MSSKKRKEWEKVKREYYKLNPPGHEGYVTCAICQKWTQNPDVDHIKNKGSHPELASDLKNLQYLCRGCHRAKTDHLNR